ncbi:terminase large subunit [Limnobacter alexandrii]|uniref:terminase large subunit n=1 Tax=Limnobacter alexandrii TaxID=2570352 RepID=UPI001109E9E2|nr:terminase TerL endonuclease subunit [Limnobacter alexandrii]
MTTRKAKQASTSRRDPASAFAQKVVAGKIVAGPHVRAACSRHLKDLDTGHLRGLKFDTDSASRAIGFFADVLRLNGGEYEGKPYELLDWQCFIVGSLFGWMGPDGYRRFRVAYVETAKGSGKSPLAAGIGLYGLMADGEAGAEIYAAATKKDQAMVLFRDAVAMVDHSPELSARITKSGTGLNVWNLAWLQTRSFFKPIASDDGQSGPRPHISLLDELHEHKDAYVIEMLKAGQKSRRQALQLAITNSGTNKQTVCWDYHEYGAKVSAGSLQDDTFFAFICSLDEGDDPFKDEKCWYKANPSLRFGLPGLRYLREQVSQARGMPSKESIVRRLNFCQWVEASSPWISGDVWFACKDSDFDVESLRGRKCYGGLDLSSTQDLTALVLHFEPTENDPRWRQLEWFWLPGDGLHEKGDKDRVPYTRWRQEGHLEALPGKAINKLAVARRAAEIASIYDLKALAFDRWRIEDFVMICEQEGIDLPLQPFGQGFKDMAPAVDEYERRLIGGELAHRGNPVMTWCAANAVVMSDPAGNRKVAKEKATGRCDGIVAGIMAAGVSITAQQDSEVSFWDS